MIQRTLRTFALPACAALLLGAAALQGSTVKSDKFEIPFAFQVQSHTTLPAGEYRVQQEAGSDIAVLVNTKTGERVQFLRPAPADRQSKARLIFEDTANGHLLKQIS